MSIDRMLSWFPNAWRSRYEAEVRDLLESHPFGWSERRDLLRCCLDAWARELRSWGEAVLRFSWALGLRLAIVWGAGWLGLLGVAYLDSLVGVRLWPPVWRDAVMGAQGMILFLQLLAFLMLSIKVIGPYTRSGREVDRPSLGTAVLASTAFGLLQFLDLNHAHLGDVIFFGMIATMRYASWLGFLRSKPTFTQPTSLGLR